MPVLSKEGLMSMKVLADNGYTTIFHAYSNRVTVHENKDVKIILSRPPALQGWSNLKELWVVPLADKNRISKGIDSVE